MANLQTINMIRQDYKLSAIVERIALFALPELEKKGYDCILIKPNVKKPKTWKLMPKNYDDLTEDQKKEFEAVKKQIVDDLKTDEKNCMRDVRRSLIGR